jgi:hypothetical protein
VYSTSYGVSLPTFKGITVLTAFALALGQNLSKEPLGILAQSFNGTMITGLAFGCS